MLATNFLFVIAVVLWTNVVSGQDPQGIASQVFVILLITSNPFTDVHLELRKRIRRGLDGIEMESILNHDLLDIEIIGERMNFGDTFLVCVSSMQNETREWYFPNGTVVSSDDSNMGPDIYISKDREDTLVRLNRRRNATTPIGIYCCEVGSSGITTRSLCVGIYNSTGGMIIF